MAAVGFNNTWCKRAVYKSLDARGGSLARRQALRQSIVDRCRKRIVYVQEIQEIQGTIDEAATQKGVVTAARAKFVVERSRR